MEKSSTQRITGSRVLRKSLEFFGNLQPISQSSMSYFSNEGQLFSVETWQSYAILRLSF